MIKHSLSLPGKKKGCLIEIENNFDKLCQLLLIEEFKKCLPSEVKTYLDKKIVETLSYIR